MKKVLLLIISVLFAIQANAQTQEESPTVTIDSLSTKLAELQHNYDFLYCHYQLYQIEISLQELSQDIQITDNELTIKIYFGQYDHDMYIAYSEDYDAKCRLYDVIKRKFEVVQELVTIKIATTGFTESELNVFNACIETIESVMKAVESNLSYYDKLLKIYKDKRWQYSWQ